MDNVTIAISMCVRLPRSSTYGLTWVPINSPHFSTSATLKSPKKCSSPAPCSFGLPLHFSALKSLLIHRSCMGVYMGWAQLKQHTGPLQLASCSVLWHLWENPVTARLVLNAHA